MKQIRCAVVLALVATAGCSAVEEEPVGISESGLTSAIAVLESHSMKTFDDLRRAGLITLTPEQEEELATKGFVLGVVPDELLPVAHHRGAVVEMTEDQLARLRTAEEREAAGEVGAVFRQTLEDDMFDPRDPASIDAARRYLGLPATATVCPVASEVSAPEPIDTTTPDTTNIDVRAALSPSPSTDASHGASPIRPLADVPAQQPCGCKFVKATLLAAKKDRPHDGSQRWLFVSTSDATLVTPGETADIKAGKLKVIEAGGAPDDVRVALTLRLTFEGTCSGDFTVQNGPRSVFNSKTTTSSVAVNAAQALKNTGSVAMDVTQDVVITGTEKDCSSQNAKMKLVAKMGSDVTVTKTKGFGWNVGGGNTGNNQTTGSGGFSGGKSGTQTNFEGRVDGMYTTGGTTHNEAGVNGNTYDTYVYSPANLAVQASNNDNVVHDYTWHGTFGQSPGGNTTTVSLKYDVAWSMSPLDPAFAGTGKADYRVKVVGQQKWETEFDPEDVSVVFGEIKLPASTTPPGSDEKEIEIEPFPKK